MQVRDGMSKVVLTVGPGHTLREAARLMADRRVGAAVVLDPDSPGPGILTERDRDADGEEDRLDAAAGQVDLLAGGRDLGLERAHEM